jgi:hypothetical protein
LPPRLPDETDALGGLDTQAEIAKHPAPVGITKVDVLEFDGRARAHQRGRLRVIAQAVRDEKSRERLRQTRQMLGDVHQRHRQIPCRVQDGKAQRANQHDVARGRGALLPKHNGPGQQGDDQDDGHRGVEQAQFFQIQETAPARRHFPVDGGVEPAMLATDPAKRPYQGHVADDVHHFAINRRRPVGEFVMQRAAGGGETEHGQYQNTGKRHQCGGHGHAYRHDKSDGDQRRHAWRQNVPNGHVL